MSPPYVKVVILMFWHHVAYNGMALVEWHTLPSLGCPTQAVTPRVSHAVFILLPVCGFAWCSSWDAKHSTCGSYGVWWLRTLCRTVLLWACNGGGCTLIVCACGGAMGGCRLGVCCSWVCNGRCCTHARMGMQSWCVLQLGVQWGLHTWCVCTWGCNGGCTLGVRAGLCAMGLLQTWCACS